MLVATLEARGKCDYVKQLNSTAAYYWTLLEKGFSLEEMTEMASVRFGVSRQRIRPGLVSFINTLILEGYLLVEEEA